MTDFHITVKNKDDADIATQVVNLLTLLNNLPEVKRKFQGKLLDLIREFGLEGWTKSTK